VKCGTISSATFFDPVLNPGYRLDASFGLSLGAIEQGRIDMLRQCFDDLFSRPAQAREWWNSFRKCKAWDEAEDHLLCVYGIKRASKAQLPMVFRQGMSALLRSLLSDNLQQLKAESQTIQVRIQQLKTLLETPETDGRPSRGNSKRVALVEKGTKKKPSPTSATPCRCSNRPSTAV